RGGNSESKQLKNSSFFCDVTRRSKPGYKTNEQLLCDILTEIVNPLFKFQQQKTPFFFGAATGSATNLPTNFKCNLKFVGKKSVSK
ncbi:MAG: hypothetical protein J6V70_02470, partial [Kiritimatiellae bacterium]|nr:hypothetical protein [Kiritimatiellia bacterium]